MITKLDVDILKSSHVIDRLNPPFVIFGSDGITVGEAACCDTEAERDEVANDFSQRHSVVKVTTRDQ